MLIRSFAAALRSASLFISALLVVVTVSSASAVFAREAVPESPQTAIHKNAKSFAAAPDPQKIFFDEIASGLVDPIFITHANDGSGRIFVLERAGKIRIIKNGVLLATPFLDIHTAVKSTSGEQGLLALAFHPSYGTNGKFYVVYTSTKSGDTTGSNLILKKFKVSANNPDLADASNGTVLLSISHPLYSNHNGGALAFGQDGYLYWSTGDGGSGGDPNNNSQNLNSLLGKLLRLDVDSSATYKIPVSNPFYASPDPNIRKEIWAYGLRNPWRLSFDRLTHDLYIGDVGQGNREEIDVQPANSIGGENYGWRIMEGTLCYNPSSGCNTSGKTLPVTEYNHTIGCSVTGGYVYRGTNYPSLSGYYFYGDYCSGRLFSLINASGWVSAQLVDTPYNITSFGEDEQGELYVIDYATGKIYHIGYQEELISPVLNSIVRTDADPAHTLSVNFTVTFSEKVLDVNPDDFTLVTTGVSDASISAVAGSGSIYTVTVNTGTGNGTIRLDVPDTATITDPSGNELSNLPFTTGEMYTINKTSMAFNPTNIDNGWILETSETSSVGGSLNTTGKFLRLGDDAANRQYRSILSFNTSALPDEAIVTSVTLKLKYAGILGTNPFTTHGNLLVDVRKGAFSGNSALQLLDFNATASKTKVLSYTNTTVDSWYSQSFKPAGFPFINLGGVTQFRLRFSMDDNHDFGADYLKVYNGNALLVTDRPQLIIEYYVP